MEFPPTDVTEDYHYGVLLLSFSIVVEVFAEVPFVLTELHLWAKTKVNVISCYIVFIIFYIVLIMHNLTFILLSR